MKNCFFWIILSIVALALPAAASTQVRIYRGGGGYLGVEIRDVTTEDVAGYRLSKESGVVVRSVAEGTAADEAGLREGDVIVEYAGIPVLSVAQFRRLVSETPSGRSVDIRINRDGSRQALSATIGEREGEGLLGGIHIPDIRLPEIDIDEFPRFHWEGDRGSVMVLSSRPRLGITGTPLTSQMAEFLKVPGSQGVLITEVKAGSPADKAGLKAGDVITAIDGDSIDDLHGLSLQLHEEEHELEYYRNGQAAKAQVNLKSERKGGKRRIRGLQTGRL